ncbi:PadR family transcriptional regulator [Paeniglutamicibacter antarcticus]|uniref:PadR family transcriptional regulator n=1 Tax=Paeniglutamicibacter antarcticus TaxID=494023 RepID=A0ABP9TJM9_9MICC
MSSIRIFILGALADRGAMHGHQLRLLATEEHVSEWADITVGGLYGAIKRLAAESLIEELRVEQPGNYPKRQVWGITENGRRVLVSLQLNGLREVMFKPDPFDLALTRLDFDHLENLPAIVEARIATFQGMLADQEAQRASVARYLTVAERIAMAHRTERLKTEIDWHRQLAERVGDIIADERNRKAIVDD